MKVEGLLRALLLVALGCFIGGCAGAPVRPGALPDALSSFVVWSQVGLVPEQDTRGDNVDVVHVRGGEVMRIEFANDTALEVGERMSSGQNFAESWAKRTPMHSVLLMRTGAFSTALLLPRGAALRVYRGHGSDPGYHWFELEDRVLEWANGPLRRPFPGIAPRERVDFEGFAALDGVLADAVLRAADRQSAIAEADAVRLVAGLRAVRALRPPTGLPYFFDTALSASPNTQATVGAHAAYLVSRATPLELPVSGPGVLHLWARSPAAASELAELRVFEGDRPRAFAQLTTPRAPLTSRDPAAFGATSTIPVRRAIVHVPPGLHRYRLESSADVLVSPLLAEPIVHLEQVQQEDEAVQLTRARQACAPGGAPPICALALALLGNDQSTERTNAAPSEWDDALAKSPGAVRRVAVDLARGGPRDPIPGLDLAASGGDPTALASLRRSAAHSVDEGARAGWVHSLSQGTEWQVAESGSAGPPWLSVAAESDALSRCASHGIDDAAEVTAIESDYQTVMWHGVPTIELVVTSDCNDARPVELLVDGERLTAVPSAPRVRLRVRVRGEQAKIRRLDASTSRVSALRARAGDCRLHFESLRAPAQAATAPSFRVGGEPGSAGVEVWLRAGARIAELEVRVSEVDGSDQITRLTVPRVRGVTAFDAMGVLWTRIARVPLAAPRRATVRITGSADLAVRPLLRVTRRRPASARATPPAVPLALDEATLTETTREILAQPRDRRGPLYLKRALILAAGGARGPALADARAASQLGARGPQNEEPIALVQAAIPRLPIAIEPLPDGVNAYGIDRDFDPAARKCEVATTGARAELEEMLETTSEAGGASGASEFNAERAASAYLLHQKAALDPRAAHLLSRVLAGSRWKLRTELDGGAPRVREGRDARRDGPLDSDGDLRPRVAVGGGFTPGTYATVLPGRPVKALISGIPTGARVHLELACAAREPVAARPACPIDLLFDGKPLALALEQDGRGLVQIPEARGRSRPLLVLLRDEPGDWVALARLVVDHPLPKAVRIDEGHWAIVSQSSELRTVIREGSPAWFDAGAPTLLRVDARAESEARTELVLTIDGRERLLAADGTPVVVPVVKGAKVELRARGGALSLAVAERVPSDRAPKPKQSEAVRDVAPATAIGLLLDSGPDGSEPSWFQRAERSPEPLTPLQAALGTAVAETGVVYGKLRQREPSAWADAYAFNLLGYRRRVESLGLWTRGDVFSRTRPGEPTYGAQVSLYEDLERAHVRVTGSLMAETQTAAGIQGRSLLARGFFEYSYRASRNFFVLPRLGYDGMYSSVARRPTSLSYVDDEVYNPYRARRPTFVFAQALLWYAPYFNEILYLRVRGTFDAKARAFSHSAAALGAFIALGDLDLAGQAQTIWYIPRDSLTNSAHLETLAGVVARYSFWSGLGSLGITPGVSAVARPQDAGWQVTGFVNFFASFRRGLKDFSSLELDFPEQLSGGIPWRGATPGGYQ